MGSKSAEDYRSTLPDEVRNFVHAKRAHGGKVLSLGHVNPAPQALAIALSILPLDASLNSKEDQRVRESELPSGQFVTAWTLPCIPEHRPRKALGGGLG